MIRIHPDYRAELVAILAASDVPGHMHFGLIEHIMDGQETGGFLTAVLEGNLFEALRRADAWNIRALPAFAGFLFNHAPRGCYGTPEKVSEWIGSGGIMGRYERAQAEAAK